MNKSASESLDWHPHRNNGYLHDLLFFLTVLFTKQGIYIHSTIQKKNSGRQKSGKFTFLYIIVINIPPMRTDDIYIKSSNTSAKEIRRQNIYIPPKRKDDIYIKIFDFSAKKITTTIHTEMNTIAFKFSSICRCTN